MKSRSSKSNDRSLHRVHNAYMLAAAWRLVGQTLDSIADDLGGDDSRVRELLKKDADFRDMYLELYEFVTNLVRACQEQFALLATTSSTVLVPLLMSLTHAPRREVAWHV